ncbi:hypothetical protein HCJ45_13345 [Listeria sp. FSL L7-1517]|uniref:MucBP domain-containing protein n=1 Tax=Listeria immobilis TaxID=2713502 RepID=UPI00164D0693|nr:MucBP domain-containing protein [Listeria immobilis]MBC6298094.1 hypothetical protein [Listeria immobilis]
MKKSVKILMVCLLIAFGCLPVVNVRAAETDIVNIPDQNLNEGLKITLSKGTAEILTERDLAQLGAVAIDYTNPAAAVVPGRVSDLTGLEYAVNMYKIHFSNSDVKKITPITDLPNLKTIIAVSTLLENLEGIQNLPALEELQLGGDYIQDFSPLLGAEKLTYFSYNSYRWISSDYSAISDISILAQMQNLERLDLTWNEVEDLSPLNGNNSIQNLNLTHNKVQSLSPLTNMDKLTILYLDQNALSSLNEIKSLEGMKIVYADSNHIVDVSELKPLFEKMVKGNDDYKELQIKNQTITLPTISVRQGETATSNNPTKGLDGEIMPIQTASSSGQISADSKNVSWSNLTQDTNATYKIATSATSESGVDFNYSLTVTQPIKVLSSTESQVNIKYVDEEGNNVASGETLSGTIGDNYTTTAKAITGWTLKETPANATGTFTNTTQTVTYVYEKDQVVGQDVTVQYQDIEGNELASTETLSGNVGDTYSATEKAITGWTLKETPANATGTFTNAAQTVTYVYEKDQVVGQDVTVQYQDIEGNELASTETLSGNVGDTYSTTEKAITGWTLKERPANATGTFTNVAQTVTYVYEENGSKSMPTPLPLPQIPIDPGSDNPETNNLPNERIQIKPQEDIKISSSTKTKTKPTIKLPKTGDDTLENAMLVSFGLFLIGISAKFIRRFRREN